MVYWSHWWKSIESYLSFNFSSSDFILSSYFAKRVISKNGTKSLRMRGKNSPPNASVYYPVSTRVVQCCSTLKFVLTFNKIVCIIERTLPVIPTFFELLIVKLFSPNFATQQFQILFLFNFFIHELSSFTY